MTDWLMLYLPSYGLPMLALVIALGCLGVPLPASLLMLVAGTLVAAGDLSLQTTFFSCLGAAVAGDHIGFLAGRLGRSRVQSNPLPLVQRAQAYLAERGAAAVFFSRWLVSPLCPVVNIAAGASPMPVTRFTPYELAGEIVWVSLYLGLGYAFGGYVTQIADALGSATAALALGLLAVVAGRMLWNNRKTKTPPNTLDAKMKRG